MARKSEPRNDGRPGEPSAVVSWWLNEFEAARKREKDYRKNGKRVLEIYGGNNPDSTPFNILFSNTETLLPSLYSTAPRPVVQRRFKDDDPLGKVAALAGQRMLEFLVDTNVEGYETFDEGMRSAVLTALLPGRGVTCVKYDAVLGDLAASGAPFPPGDAPAPAPSLAEASAAPSMPATDGAVETSYKMAELVCAESRPWEKIYYGYARKWSKVPWLAYEEYIDRKEAERLFGGAKAATLKYTADEGEKDRDDKDDERKKNLGDRRVALVYQIWDKAGGEDGERKIRYISPGYPDGYLKVEDDPLGLTGFFNSPRPLQFVEKPHDLTPVAPYLLYQNQARELNRLTIRINRIVEAIKARGAYDASLGDDIGKIMEADDNALVAAETASTMAAEKGLSNAIWFMPIEQLVAVLTQLYAAREQCKRVIYEITGIADILRGSSKASETLGAQEIKERWGTLRLKRLQRDVQRYARDMLRMMLELAATKFSEETWARITGLPFVTGQRRMQLEQIAMAAQMSQQPLDQQTQQELAKPAWDKVLAALRDDMQRAYRIDIETNSTIEPEAAEDQKNIAELMTALAQYLNGVGPLVAKGVMPFGAAQSMLLAISRRFRFGSEIEDEIKAMQPPKPEDDGKQAAMQKEQLSKDAAAAQAKIAAESQVAQLQAKLTNETAQRQMADSQHNLEIRQIKLGFDEALFAEKQRMAEQKIRDTGKQVVDKIAGEQKVNALQAASSKREQQVAQKADSAIASGVSSLQKTVAQLAQMQATLLQAIAQPLVENQQLMTNLVKAITAPRKRKAIRGADGKIAETLEEVAA